MLCSIIMSEVQTYYKEVKSRQNTSNVYLKMHQPRLHVFFHFSRALMDVELANWPSWLIPLEILCDSLIFLLIIHFNWLGTFFVNWIETFLGMETLKLKIRYSGWCLAYFLSQVGGDLWPSIGTCVMRGLSASL